MTCTTTDPLVATLFASECLFHGHAVIHLAPRIILSPFVGPSNYFDEKELAVNLNLKPLDFLEFVKLTFEVNEAREILWAMGFDQIPSLICGKYALDEELTRDIARNRLAPDQIHEFNRRAWEILQ